MKMIRFLGIIVVATFLISCSMLLPTEENFKPLISKLLPPTSIKNGDIKNYPYFYVMPTNILTSSSGHTISGQYYSTSKSIDPSDVISGILLKEGFIRLPSIKPELTEETLIVNYGESGRRNLGLGYTIEVTIQFIASEKNFLVCSCTAEGQGSTEADDIRQAITRCLEELIPKRN